ncbi:nucleoside-binding protein [Catenovulum sp. SX2]|uniref:nucleoside-binding protein n=1 Tax=Catenovulum sp. SX2 TaxID=3398614 RepID=UPI003F82A2C5
MRFVFSILVLFGGFNLHAKMLWSDASFTYLNGSNYQVGDNKREVYTFEHAAKTTWGDSFLFIEQLQSNNGDKQIYGEISPRFELLQLENSIAKSLFVATTVEFSQQHLHDGSSREFAHYLLGLGTKFTPEYFSFVNLNLYKRFNDSGDSNYQLTLAWALPFDNWLYDGFIDYASAVSGKSPTMNFTSQLKYNLASLLSLDTKVFVGVEYVFWNDKFGIDGVNERNANLLVKVHF